MILTATAFAGGEPTVIGIVQAGECFGEEAFLGQNRLVTAHAGPRSHMIAINPGVLPPDSRLVLDHIFSRLAAMVAEVSALKSVPPAQRLARLLIALARKDTGAAIMPRPATHKVMAGWIGVRPETFSGLVLPKLKQVGVSFLGGRIDIADLAALASFAQTRSVMKGAR